MITEFFESWKSIIPEKELQKALHCLSLEREDNISPKKNLIFRAFFECPFPTLKVVFLGMEPYANQKDANGLCFGNESSIKNPSLKVLLDSINKYYKDVPLGIQEPSLQYLAKQGILLLNSALTVRVGETGSNLIYWKSFTSSLLLNIQKEKPNTIFVLFGKEAQQYSKIIKNQSLVIPSLHPSYCARNNILLDDIFSIIDEKMFNLGEKLIFWK